MGVFCRRTAFELGLTANAGRLAASNDSAAAASLASDYENVSSRVLDASNEAELRDLIANADVVLR